MIYLKTGNLLESESEALVNTVNTDGVMGKGIALQFKNYFPKNFKVYYEHCKSKEFNVGQLLVCEDESLFTGKKIIINFPTKTNWRLPSEYSYISFGLEKLKELIIEKKINSIAIPPLGAGNGGLDWDRVKSMIIKQLGGLDASIYLYEPTKAITEALKKERVKLTPARAMLLYVMYDLVRNGETISEFTAEKIAYFLQRFGAKENFKLEFRPNFYGPYSGKVKHVLYYLNGSYISGYSSKDKKPFEELTLLTDGENDVLRFLNNEENLHYKNIAQKTSEFLQGFYSPFGLELLSSVDFIMSNQKIRNTSELFSELKNWNNRKKTLFNNEKFVEIAVQNITKHIPELN
jgi:O-acetyl-ADP-ribose deacetylase (regulator of RNase III)